MTIKTIESAYIVVGSVLAAIVIIFIASVASAAEIPQEVYCVIGEAESEGAIGMQAVSEAIRNRGHLRGVYGCKAPRVIGKKYSQRTLEIARKAWADSAGSGDITHGATHWEGTAFKTPYWAKDMIVTATIANQRFYKER